ncbi:uncharacterized protein [Palaemon carinicauda]|uniref:uncharacterized protein n=1 Tax=Palaemon carinicauda TaxID=392227 RepID=UPI0035B5886F
MYKNGGPRIIRQIKDSNGIVLAEENEIKRWETYVEGLLNDGNPRTVFEDGLPYETVTKGVTRREVEQAVKKMKNGKAAGPDNLPLEVWKGLGEEGIDILWELAQKIFNQEKMPEEWRRSLIIPIYKGKDIQECGNYRGINLIKYTMKIWEKIIEKRLRDEATIAQKESEITETKETNEYERDSKPSLAFTIQGRYHIGHHNPKFLVSVAILEEIEN